MKTPCDEISMTSGRAGAVHVRRRPGPWILAALFGFEYGAPALPDCHRYFIAWCFMKVLHGKFAIAGRLLQIREFPLARKIAGTQPGRVHYHARSGKSKQTY